MTPDTFNNSEHEERITRRGWVPWLIALAGLVISAVISIYVAVSHEREGRLRFQTSVVQIRESIQKSVDTYITLLDASRGLFIATPDVTRSMFHVYAEELKLRTRYPGMQGIGFSKRVKAFERDRITSQMIEQGAETFRIWPEAPARDEYSPILLIEPFDARNAAAAGFDMYSDPVRREAMQSACDSGEPRASGKVVLMQEIHDEKQPGFLIYSPLYRGGTVPASVEERRNLLEGFIYAPFRAGDLLSAIIPPAGETDLHIEVYDGFTTSHTALLYRSSEEGMNDTRAREFSDEHRLFVAGHPWTIVYSTLPTFYYLGQKSMAALAFVIGLLVSAMLFLVTHYQVRAREVVERHAANLHESRQALLESETRLRNIVNSNVLGILIADPEGRITDANDRFLNIIGYSRDDLAGQKITWEDLTPIEYRTADHTAFQELQVEGRHRPYEKEIIRKDGWRVPVLVGSSSMGLGGDAAAFILDLSELKAAERALQESEARFRAAAEASFDAILLCRSIRDDAGNISDFSIAEVNSRGEQLLEAPREQILSSSLSRLLPFGEASSLMHVFIRVVRHAEPYSEELPVTRPGPAAWVRLQVVKLADGIALTISDITQRRQAEEQLRALNRQFEAARDEALQASQAKSLFLANMSHELRTPLNAIIGYTELLQDEAEESGTESFLNDLGRVHQASMHLLGLVNSILDLSKIEAGRMDLHLEEAEIGEILHDVCMVVRPLADRARNQLVCDFPSQVGTAFTDPIKVRQSLYNLLSNACKFTEKGTVALRAFSKEEDDQKWYVFEVADTGIGIASDDLRKLFTEFGQLDSSFTRKYGGTGLGLAISRRFCRMLGGDITVESTPGKGSIFTVQIPADSRMQSLTERAARAIS